jgi:glycosyltransferase involved in cell wall biosynthesis
MNFNICNSAITINTLHTVASLQINTGGPARSVTGLCSSLGKVGVGTFLLNNCSDNNMSECVHPDFDVVKVLSVANMRIPILNRQYPLRYYKTLKKLHAEENIQLIHDHGLWLPCNHGASVSAHRLGLPLVISPRGMLEPWALNFKKWKKKCAWWLWVRSDLNRGSGFCATSEQEALNIRKLGFKQPIAVIPNGVTLPEPINFPLKSDKSCRIALFLSRIHPIKGILQLLEAWAKLRPLDWQLMIAGPDEGGHAAEVADHITLYGLEGSVRLIGSVDDDAKWRLYQQSDLFLLPTFSENFGIVVAEALAAGTPVITTKGAPWQSLVDNNCGWWIDIGVEPLVQALGEAIALSDETRIAMGARGRNFVELTFAWEAIAGKMKAYYLWLLNQSGKPDFVREFSDQ